jgi:hypothetical protein
VLAIRQFIVASYRPYNVVSFPGGNYDLKFTAAVGISCPASFFLAAISTANLDFDAG